MLTAAGTSPTRSVEETGAFVVVATEPPPPPPQAVKTSTTAEMAKELANRIETSQNNEFPVSYALDKNTIQK
jgi:hypothetical protein